MSKTSKKYQVPDELAEVYDFANTLNLRCFSDHGVQHQMTDEIASADYLACEPEQRHYNRQVIEALNQTISGRGPCIVEGNDARPRARGRGGGLSAVVAPSPAPSCNATPSATSSCSRGGDLWSLGQLRQIVGDGEPRRLARDVDMLRRPNAGIIVECA